MFTCEGCGTAYRPVEETSVARVYVKDSRCNHIEARCSHCGTSEIIYLGPHRMQEVLSSTTLSVTVYAEASSRLRVRAENAWAAAEDEADRADIPTYVGDTHPAPLGQPQLEAGTTVVEAPQSYELTPRHEQLLASFGQTLSNIPDELLWDGLNSEHRGDLPARWTD